MITGRVWGADYGSLLHVQEIADESGADAGPMVEIVADVGDEALVVKLDRDGLRKLRLLLQRIERSQDRQ